MKPRTSRNGFVFVVGFTATAGVLLLIHFVKMAVGLDIMSAFIYSIPIGAIIAGLAVGCGYAYGFKLAGVRIKKWFVISIMSATGLAWFVFSYAEFRIAGPFEYAGTHEPVGYWEYFHLRATSWSLQPLTPGTPLPATSLGVFGYYFSIAAILGFAGTTPFAPWAQSTHPYCEACQRYLWRRQLATWPMTLKQSEASSAFSAADNWRWEYLDELEPAEARFERLAYCGQTGDMYGFRRLITINERSRRLVRTEVRRFQIQLLYCENCCAGDVKCVTLVGRRWQAKRSTENSYTLPPEFVREVMTVSSSKDS